MNKYLARLNPSERRFVVGVALLFFVVVNLFWVWPHFSDWSILKRRLETARTKVVNFEAVIQQAERLKPDLAKLESEGASVPAEDRAIEFMRTIQTQAQQTGVGITSYGHQTTRTNQFFSEQSQTISGVSDESQLVSFLYNLGSGNSLIRVRAISVRPDQVRQRLNSNVTLVASYQKTHAPPQPAASAAKVPRPQPAPPAAKSPPPPAKPADPRPPTAQKK